MTDAAAPRSEHLLRLHRTGPGQFVCDQRPVGGKLWMVRREGRRGWWVKAHHEPADSAVVLPLGAVRGFLAERAAEATAAAEAEGVEP